MKKTVINIAALFLITVVTGMLATADTMSEYVAFRTSIVVNGTLIEDGTYKLEFNDQTGMLSFKKGREIVASVPARLVTVDKDSHVEYTTRTVGDTSILTSVTMDDGYRAVVVESTA